MSLAITYCRAVIGIEAPQVVVETHLANGLPSFSLVGLPEKAVQESRDRVRSALINCGFDFPSKRITVNLAPADIPKQGSGFDLAIAIGILYASQQIQTSRELPSIELLGELTLGGEIRPVNGVLPAAIACRSANRSLAVADNNCAEASLVQGLDILPLQHLLQLTAHLAGEQPIPLYQVEESCLSIPSGQPDLIDIRGQQQAKRALEIQRRMADAPPIQASDITN